jgi:prefoldin subunit 5|tara:strand:+ start:328 stop:504 length:177 start_codon:yes stop_codon:yes gene_type:complete
MKEQIKYTQKEIDRNINILENTIDNLKRERTELSKSINEKKKQVVSWRELDLHQIKMF